MKYSPHSTPYHEYGVLLFILFIRLLISKEIRRECGQVIGPSVGIILPPRSIVLKNDQRTTPVFGSRTGCDTNDRLIHRSIRGQGTRRVPQMQGETQRFPIKALGQDNTVGLSPREISVDERTRAGTLSRSARRLAVHGNDPRPIWKLRG